VDHSCTIPGRYVTVTSPTTNDRKTKMPAAAAR
jgi:hypothetical protein